MEKVKKKEPSSSEWAADDDGEEKAGSKRSLNHKHDGMQETSQKSKIIKLSRVTENHVESCFNLNSDYFTDEFKQIFKTHWNAVNENKVESFKDEKTEAEFHVEPFKICVLPQLMQNKLICRQLVDEMVNKVHWSRKQMDLYEFYQSNDISSMAACKVLSKFLQVLRHNVRPWLESITNLKLDYVSASCSMYTCGDYLLVHDDLLKDRQVAFVYYLSPWENAENWNETQGGCLEIFDSDQNCFPNFPVRRKISPKNNQFVFFKVGSRSFHQVKEVTNFDYPRLTINGWFHGASNDDVISDNLRPFSKLLFKPPRTESHLTLDHFLNDVYMKQATKRSIQKRIEDNSEICLYEFFQREIYEKALKQLLNDETLKWKRQGPANAQNYEVLELNSASETIQNLLELFAGTQMFSLLQEYTDLDLAGPNLRTTPTYSLELQRWSHGNYTVLGDGAICEDNTLDLIYYLNASDGAAVITYLSPEPDEQASTQQTNRKLVENSESEFSEDELEKLGNDEEEDDLVLLTITPVNNALNIVYRCEGTTKFTKYVSHNTPLEAGPVFLISCSYKE